MAARIAVLGAGAWGRALCRIARQRGHEVRLWSHVPEELTGPEVPNEVLKATEIGDALGGAEWVVIVVPSHGFRQTLERAHGHLSPGTKLISATKGIENGSLMLMSEVAKDVLGDGVAGQFGCLSGPSFAKEVAAGTPTNVVLAALDAKLAVSAQKLLSTTRLRIYTSEDVLGVEIAGALKNVIAIAAGASDGLGFGLNTRAALITRGLAEIARLTLKKGGKLETSAGLAGLGDLILTTTGELSRNRELGYRIGKGHQAQEVLRELPGVAEGYRTAQSAVELAASLGVELPICEQVYQVLYHGRPAAEAVQALLQRPLRREWE